MAADQAPTTLRGIAVSSPVAQAQPPAPAPPVAAPKSGKRKKAEMTRGEKAAATRKANKKAAESATTSKKKGTGMRHPKNWDAMSRGEKAAWTRKANERAGNRAAKKDTPKREPKEKKGKAKKATSTKKEDGQIKRLNADKAKAKLEKIRLENPDLARAIEEEIEARASRDKLQGKKGRTAIVDALAPLHQPGSGDIVKSGSTLGYALDGAIVIGTGLLSTRLDDMIAARPLGLSPSDILGIVEAIVLAIGVFKKNRKVVRYSSLMLTGTVGAKIIKAAVRRSGSAPSP